MNASQLKRLAKRASNGAVKVQNYAKAMAKWITAGRPRRNVEEVESILMAHCQPCDQFQATADGTHGCEKCGCKAVLWTGGLREKISMATESCPVGKWEAEAADVNSATVDG